MPATKRENHNEESLDTKKLIKSYQQQIKDYDKKIKKEKLEKEKLEKEKLIINSEKKDFRKKIEKLKTNLTDLTEIKNKLQEEIKIRNNDKEKDTKYEEKDKEKLENLRKEIEEKVQVKKNEQIQIQNDITELKDIKQKIINQLENNKEMKKKLENDKEIIVVNNDNVNFLIKIKELEILKLRSNIADLFISLKTEEKKITLLKLKESKIEQIISENKEQLITANYKLHLNKKTKKEVKIAQLEVKIKEKICEIYQLEDQLSTLLVVDAKNNKKISDFNISISELEKSSIEVKEAIKQIKNKAMKESITTPSPAEDNVNINQKTNKKRWFRGIFKPIIKFIWGSKQKITISYYQNKQKTLNAEIRKLESEKLKNFWNKFWLIISCGCYNNNGKMDRKIAEKRRELEDIKKELEKLSKNNISNNESQPSTSSAPTNQDDAWSNKTKVEIEKTPLVKENSKNLSSTLT